MSRGRKKQQSNDRQIIFYELIGLALVALSLIMLVSIYVMSKGYVTYDSNPGAIGNFLVKIAEGLMGKGKLLLPFALLYLGLRYIKNNIGIKYDLKTLGISLLLSAFLMILHVNVTSITYKENLQMAIHGEGGGLLGALLTLLFRSLFGLWGTWIIAITFIIAGIMMLTGLSLKRLLNKAQTSTQNAWQNNKDTLFDLLFVEEEISTTSVDSLPRAEDVSKPNNDKKRNLLIDMSDHDSKKRKYLENVKPLEEKDDTPTEYPPLILISDNTQEEHIEEEIKMPTPVLENKEDKVIEKEKVSESEPPFVNKIVSEFKTPPLTLLDGKKSKNTNSQKDITNRVSILEETIQSFGINAKVIQVSCGPTVTRFELDIPPGVKVSKITGLAENIALRLAAKGVRIAPIPDQATIGIEVPNKQISAVSFREVLEHDSFLKDESKLTFSLGKDISGRVIVGDLTKMPHLLIAGTTGSGKSVCMNTLICSILFKAAPKEVRFLMIDPKMVELAGYNGIPHLLAPVVTDPKKAAAVLKWMVTEMDNRYEMFAQSNVRDIVRYNKQKEASGNELQKMPYYVVIIDELADLMMVASSDVEEAICRIAQKARAAGIHLVVATQRPSVDVITGLIKANIPSRIAFAVSSQTDSRTILDSSGAEKLLGRGDMLFHPVGEQSPIRIQGAFVSDKEVENIVSFLKEASEPQYEEKVMGVEAIKTEDKTEASDDMLFYKAGVTLLEAGQASTSMLQRKLKVGYARAGRLIDTLEDFGVIGPHEGSKPRQIIMSLDEFEARFGEQRQED